MTKPWVGKKVVIVDDSASVREELRRAFEACGVTVAGLAENGVVGLAQIEKTRPEIVSLDIIMPEMDGVECYRKIREHGFDCKIVVVSWIAGEQKIQENLRDLVHPYQFQTKPVSPSDLEMRLQRIYFPEREVIKVAKQAAPELEADVLDDLGVKVS